MRRIQCNLDISSTREYWKLLEKETSAFRGIKYVSIKSRDEFTEAMASFENCIKSNTYYLCEKDEHSRIVGGFITITPARLDIHRALIDSNTTRRDHWNRRLIKVPGLKDVKQLRCNVGYRYYSLYHRTHLVPFRMCLNDGEYEDVMFAGTARLNMGLRFEDHYVPEKFQRDDDVEEVMNNLARDPYFYKDPNSTTHLYLDAFERFASNRITQDKRLYSVYKYGIECFYDDDKSLIPSKVRVVMTNVTDKKLIFEAFFYNHI